MKKNKPALHFAIFIAIIFLISPMILTAQSQNYLQEKEKISAQIKLYRSKLLNLEQETKTTSKQINLNTSTIHKLEQEIKRTTLPSEKEKLTQEIARLKNEIDALQVNLNVGTEKIASLKTHINELQASLEKLKKAEIQPIQAQIEEKEAIVKEYSETLKKLQERLLVATGVEQTELEQHITTVKMAISQMKRAIKVLEEKLANLLRNL